MPSRTEHLGQASHNRDVAAALAGSPCDTCDWEITTLFYAVIHLVEAKMHEVKVPRWPKDHHKERKLFVHSRYGGVSAEFTALYQKCRRARYDCIKVTPQDVLDAQKRYEALRKALA